VPERRAAPAACGAGSARRGYDGYRAVGEGGPGGCGAHARCAPAGNLDSLARSRARAPGGAARAMEEGSLFGVGAAAGRGNRRAEGRGRATPRRAGEPLAAAPPTY
jgi:hypothetical protein